MYLADSGYPDEMLPNATFHLGIHSLAKNPIKVIQNQGRSFYAIVGMWLHCTCDGFMQMIPKREHLQIA